MFFVVVFGLPVAWYLFLQTFGENQFALPKIARWDQHCIELAQPSLVIREGAFQSYPNQWKRVEIALKKSGVFSLKEVKTCDLDHDLYLVDQEGWIRGTFMVNREEVDRLLAEIDIYLHNRQNDPTLSQ